MGKMQSKRRNQRNRRAPVNGRNQVIQMRIQKVVLSLLLWYYKTKITELIHAVGWFSGLGLPTSLIVKYAVPLVLWAVVDCWYFNIEGPRRESAVELQWRENGPHSIGLGGGAARIAAEEKDRRREEKKILLKALKPLNDTLKPLKPLLKSAPEPKTTSTRHRKRICRRQGPFERFG
mmetsp:Transcript_33633/g.45476  ORF Transcript_33633/g.45476 Transcript_33633/m.45476 type:complete len:177 (-) Transcript_33633:639-1169(-)